MASLLKPGLLFQAAPIITSDKEGGPRPNTTYVVCQDCSIKEYHDPTRPVDWKLTEDAMGWYFDGNKPLAVYFMGTATQEAGITEQADDGVEVSSPEPTPRAEPVCPGAPRKPRSDMQTIADFNPTLAMATQCVNDPVQTAAMAKFARGEMSYAEMRGLCG